MDSTVLNPAPDTFATINSALDMLNYAAATALNVQQTVQSIQTGAPLPAQYLPPPTTDYTSAFLLLAGAAVLYLILEK